MMRKITTLAAVLGLAAVAAVGCGRDGERADHELDDDTVEEQLSPAGVNDDFRIAVPHGDEQTLPPIDDDDDGDYDGDVVAIPPPPAPTTVTVPIPVPVPVPTRSSEPPPVAPSGDPRFQLPEDNRTPPQQEKYDDMPLPP